MSVLLMQYHTKYWPHALTDLPLQEESSLNSVAWSVDIDTGEPLVCVAGSGSKNIKIFNVVTGEVVRVSSM